MNKSYQIWLTKKEHWLIGKFLKAGMNLIAIVDHESLRSIYVNGELVGELGDNISYFPFVMPTEWIHELRKIENNNL